MMFLLQGPLKTQQINKDKPEVGGDLPPFTAGFITLNDKPCRGKARKRSRRVPVEQPQRCSRSLCSDLEPGGFIQEEEKLLCSAETVSQKRRLCCVSKTKL